MDINKMIAYENSFLGIFQIIRRVLPSMMRHNHGHIITVLGPTAIFGLGNFSDICTAKFGLGGLMESIDHELTLGNSNTLQLIQIKLTFYVSFRRL